MSILDLFFKKTTYEKRMSQEQINNSIELVNDICQHALAGSEKWWAISSEVGAGKHASVYIHRYSGKTERYGFREHGYDYLTLPGMVKLFKELELKLNGYVKYSYREYYGCGSDAITFVSSSFTPGGGTGYTVNTADGGGGGKKLEGITLYCPEHAKELREKELHEIENRNKKYKKTFG